MQSATFDLGLLTPVMRAHPPLDAATELALTRRARTSRAARDKLHAHNLKLVVSEALRYRGRGFQVSDLVQEGSIGLLRAIERFDPDRGHRLNTYAMWWIRAYILRALQRGPNVVTRVPGLLRDTSLDEELSPEVQTTRLELLVDPSPQPEESMERSEKAGALRERLERVRKRLGPVGWDIVTDRLSLGVRTLSDIARGRGLTPERVRQIERSTCVLLRRYLADFEEAA